MKTKGFIFIPVAVVLILVYGFGGDAKWPGGSPGGYTGSPGDGKDCTQCHGGTASAALGWISSDIPDEGYIPGETYTITASATGSGDKGFEISPQDKSGNPLGTLTAGTGTHLVAGNTAVTQNNATSANPAEWQFEWTAPDAGTGDVTFYGAFTVNKPVTKLSSYIAHENTGVSINETSEFRASLYPNPAKEKVALDFYASGAGLLDVTLIGMNGQYHEIIKGSAVLKGDNHVIFELPRAIPAGMYVVHLQFEDLSENLKLLIE